MRAMLPLVIVWSPYSGISSIELSAVLFFLGAILILLGWKMRRDVKLPKMGKILGIVVIIIWAFAILTFLRINRDLSRYTGAAGNLGPIFPVTIIAAFCAFGFVAYETRGGGIKSSLGNGFLAFIAGPMVFEFPFLLIVIPRVNAPLIPALIFLVPLFTIIFTTLSMLFLSRRVALTRYSLYFYGAMIFVFGLWALEGYSYPSNPEAFALNAISKILGFASVAAMFVTKELTSLREQRAKQESMVTEN
jgi:hypothetical protein